MVLGAIVGSKLLVRGSGRLQRRTALTELTNRTLFEGTGQALLVVGPKEQILKANHAFENLAGYAKSELQSERKWLEFFSPADQGPLREAHALRRRYPYSAPERTRCTFVDKLGQTRPVRLRFARLPKRGQWLLVLEDQTDHVRMLQGMHRTEASYRGIFENANFGIFQTTPEGQYLNANHYLARLYGYDSPEDLIAGLTNIQHQLYVDPAQRECFLAQMQEHDQVLGFESQIYRRDGTVIWINEHARAVRDEHCRVLYFEGMVEDITQRKRSEQQLTEQYELLKKTLAELETAQSTLIEQERLRALGQMASGIAHDFNNTLSPILGFSELLLKRPKNLEDPEKVKRYLEMIHTSAKDATNVVRCLREFYRLRSEQEIGVQLDINQLIEQCIQLTQPRWKNQAQASGIQLKVQTELSPLPVVYGVESALREVLMNLIFNALDAMSEGGVLTLRSRVSGGCVEIEVSDSGCGMPAEVRKRCLEPFFTTKGSRGTGLGLAMVYGVIQRHGGRIEIQSEERKGTTICIQLPVREQPRPRPAIAEPERIMRELSVLMMEDDPLVREVLIEYLQGDGYRVTAAANGREGLALFKPGEFDLVLTDKSMPELSGDQVAAEIKRMDAHQPVVMLTGFGDMMQAVGELPLGVDYILSKPLTLHALREVLAQVQGGECEQVSG